MYSTSNVGMENERQNVIAAENVLMECESELRWCTQSFRSVRRPRFVRTDVSAGVPGAPLDPIGDLVE